MSYFIKRKNISSGQIVDLALKSAEIGTNSFSEVILGLPGDTKEKHIESVRFGIENNVSSVRMHQAILLTGTPMASKKTRIEHGLKTKFRMVPGTVGFLLFLVHRAGFSQRSAHRGKANLWRFWSHG